MTGIEIALLCLMILFILFLVASLLYCIFTTSKDVYYHIEEKKFYKKVLLHKADVFCYFPLKPTPIKKLFIHSLENYKFEIDEEKLIKYIPEEFKGDKDD